MPEVVSPAAFNEQFTLYLNTDGKPVQRALHEMTADQAWQAFRWHNEESDRLQPEADAAKAVLDDPEQRAALNRAQFQTNLAAVKRSMDASAKHLRLARLIRTQMPQWDRHPLMELRDALRRYWPWPPGPRSCP